MSGYLTPAFSVVTKTFPVERVGATTAVAPLSRDDAAEIGWRVQRAIFDARMHCLRFVYDEDRVPIEGRETVHVKVEVMRDCVAAEAARGQSTLAIPDGIYTVAISTVDIPGWSV